MIEPINPVALVRGLGNVFAGLLVVARQFRVNDKLWQYVLIALVVGFGFWVALWYLIIFVWKMI